MEHLLLKAVTTATDQGAFTAVISTASVDRDKDIIEPSAMVASLAKWAALGKLVPLAYNHTDEVIGHIEPGSVKVENDEVIVKGQIDLETERGQEMWRLVKSGTLSFSFGYLFDPKNATKLQGGRYRVKELDIFEISTIPVGPANNDTRVLDWKSALKDEELADRAKEIERDEAHRTLAEGEPKIEEAESDEKAAGMAALMSRMRELMNREAAPTGDEMLAFARQIMSTLGDSPAKSLEDLRKAADEAIGRYMKEPTPTVDAIERESAFNLKAEIQRAQDALVAVELFDPEEVAAAKAGDLKAIWTAAYINDLPDSAFLHVEPGDKDSEGKTTPRSNRHFPYKDATGAVDLPHLRNALARIPQSNLPQDVKDRLTARAQRILDSSKTADVIDRGPDDGLRSVDPLRRQADEVALRFATRGLTLDLAPVAEEPTPPQLTDLEELKRRMHDDVVLHLQGTVEE